MDRVQTKNERWALERERARHGRSIKKVSSLGESVLRELWSSLLQRDADHRVRGCCGIKGFVSQSPLTMSRQN